MSKFLPPSEIPPKVLDCPPWVIHLHRTRLLDNIRKPGDQLKLSLALQGPGGPLSDVWFEGVAAPGTALTIRPLAKRRNAVFKAESLYGGPL